MEQKWNCRNSNINVRIDRIKIVHIIQIKFESNWELTESKWNRNAIVRIHTNLLELTDLK